MSDVRFKMALRVLIVDDDQQALERAASELRGESLVLEGRKMEVVVQTLQVDVEPTDDGYRFTEGTLNHLLEAADGRWDLILLDYSFASRTIQPHQWGEGTSKKRMESNDHLLTVVDLQRQAVSAPNLRAADKRRLERFFASGCDLVLRSFQHDRPVDKLGPYESRFNNTQGVFPNARLQRLDSFSMIYGSDADLRRAFYLEIDRGREFYRNIVNTMTILHVRAAIARKLARANRRVAIPRSAAVLALLTSAVWALSAVLAAMVPDLVTALSEAEWGIAVRLGIFMLVATVAGTYALTLLVDRGIRSAFTVES